MLTLCGNYCLLNVFLAIACDSLDQAAELTAAEEAEKERAEEEARKAELEAAGLDPAADAAKEDEAEDGGENPLLAGDERGFSPVFQLIGSRRPALLFQPCKVPTRPSRPGFLGRPAGPDRPNDRRARGDWDESALALIH